MEETIESGTKRQQVSEMLSIDRFSDLPEEILRHILSFLPTKFSVATSILARRWRFLWTHVPNLDFGKESRCDWMKFSTIVTTVMFRHKVQSLNTLRLSYMLDYYDREVERFESWIITTAISRNVKNLDIFLGYGQRWLPKGLFTIETLVDLRLAYFCIDIPVNGTYLPRLKKLHLCNFQLDGDETLPSLLSGCPVLEELIIDGDYKSMSCKIYSPTIKRLDVVLCQCYTKLEINAPALRYLQLRTIISIQAISTHMLTSLYEANIRSNCAFDFVDGLNNVKCLKLSCEKSFSSRPFAEQIKPIRRFDNLTKLELDVEWPFLVKFLESADNLEVLIIRDVHSNLKNGMEPFQQVPKCLLLHLRTVRIYGFRFAEHEFKMVRYILRNAKVLKRMEIYSKQHCSIGFKKISLFERGSKACELAFY